MSDPDRAKTLRLYHALARPWYQRRALAQAAQGLTTTADELRRADLDEWVGRDSSRDCTAAELDLCIATLRRLGAWDGAQAGGAGPEADRPTPKQRARIGALARSLGWDGGLSDRRTNQFVKRTAKVSAARFLTRAKASDVILGLEAMAAGQAAQAARAQS
jgi:hypothetical protein